MKNLGNSCLALLAGAASLLASPALAALRAPVPIGTASAAAGSATLVLTTSARCPIGSALIVAVAWTPGTLSVTAVDSAGATYFVAGPGGTSTAKETTAVAVPNQGLPSGGTITLTFGSNAVAQAAEAFCAPGGTIVGPADGGAANATGTSTNPAVTPGTPNYANDLEIVTTNVVAGSADTWTESAGYTSLPSVTQGTNILRVAYQLVTGVSPTAYSATNSASRFWATNSRQFKPALCTLSMMGAGPC